MLTEKVKVQEHLAEATRLFNEVQEEETKKSVSAVDEKSDVLWGTDTELSESEGEDSEEERLERAKKLKKKLKQCKVTPKVSSGKEDAVGTQPSAPPLPLAYEEEDWK